MPGPTFLPVPWSGHVLPWLCSCCSLCIEYPCLFPDNPSVYLLYHIPLPLPAYMSTFLKSRDQCSIHCCTLSAWQRTVLNSTGWTNDWMSSYCSQIQQLFLLHVSVLSIQLQPNSLDRYEKGQRSQRLGWRGRAGFLRSQGDCAESQKTGKDVVLSCRGVASRPRGTHSPSGKSQRILQGFSMVGEDVLKSLYLNWSSW